MKLCLLALCLTGWLSCAQAADIQVYFSPSGGCTDAVVSSLNHAHSTILVQAYSFTSAPIAKAIAASCERKDDCGL